MSDFLSLPESVAAVIEIVRAMRLMPDEQAAQVLLSCVNEGITQGQNEHAPETIPAVKEAHMQGLTPGRIVHYVAYGTPKGEFPAGVHRAAMVTETYGESSAAGLMVANPTGLFFNPSVSFDEETKKPGTWHWIEPA